MPTVGWILEGAVERYWEGQPKLVPVPVPARVFRCKCGLEFHSADQLRRHFSLEHPLDLPVLYVRGEALLRESVVRFPVHESEVELYQCTRCELQVDGGPWTRLALQSLRAQFAHTTNATWNVRLVHERALDTAKTQEEYHIRFRIPNHEDLNKVDAQFISHLVVEQLSHDDLDKFELGLPKDVPSREYAGALGDYALGILLKERHDPPRSHVSFEEFAVKMRSALEVLRLFHRPVALAVSSSVRFNLNDFSLPGTPAAPELATALRFFRNITAPSATDRAEATATSSKHPPPRRAICPVDNISHRLLSAACRLAQHAPLSLADLESLKQLTRGTSPVTEQDLTKLHVTCAEGYSRLGRMLQALPHLQAIQFDPQLSTWVQTKLSTLPHHGN
jgi:hypothetical protein